jgi:hypothetical protein
VVHREPLHAAERLPVVHREALRAAERLPVVHCTLRSSVGPRRNDVALVGHRDTADVDDECFFHEHRLHVDDGSIS